MSLRGRLLVAAAAMVLIALLAADVATYSQLRSYLFAQVDNKLANDHRQVELNVARRTQFVVGSEYILLRGADGTAVVLGSDVPAPPKLPPQITGFPPTSGDSESLVSFNTPSTAPGETGFRVQAYLLPNSNQLIIAMSLADLERTLHHQARSDVLVTALAMIGVVLLGFWLIQLSLRPLAEMETTASAIAEGDLDRRVPGDNEPTEVGRLARTLNVMLARIQEAFAARDTTERQLRESEERLRRFVADASHELRTPVAAVGAYAELFERGAASRPEDLARVLAGIRSETVRMGELVEDLLLLARLDEGRPLEQQPVELVGLAAEAAGAAAAVGPEWPVRLQASTTVEVVGDAARLRQVIDNLLANVRAHTPPGTPTVVRVGERDGSSVIEVSDSGPGLPADSDGRVFERFYRADPSRSRQNGGAGLGLAIVAAIVAAHRGTVATSATPGGGATFTVWLPTTPTTPAPSPPEGANGATAASTPAVASGQ